MPALSTDRRGGYDPRRRSLLGAVVLASFVGLVAIAFLRPAPFSSDRTVRAVFADGAGIGVVGADVRIAGAPVGEIVGTRPSAEGLEVEMRIDAEAGQVHDDASAELRPHLAFEGSSFIDLDPGSPSAAVLDEDEPIAVERTRTYVPIDVGLRAVDADARADLREDVDGLADVLDEPGAGSINRMLGDAPDLTERATRVAAAAGGSEGEELAGSIAGLDRTVGAIADRREELGTTLGSAERTLAAVGVDDGARLDAVLAELPPTMRETVAGSRAADRIVAELDPLAADLRPGAALLEPTLAEAQPLVAEAGPALERARPLIADARELLDRGAAATAPLDSALDVTDPTLATLDDSLLPTLRRPTDELGLPAYVSFLNLFGGGGGASKPFTTSEQATPLQPESGHFMRFGLRFLSGVGYPVPPCDLLERANPELAGRLAEAGGCKL